MSLINRFKNYHFQLRHLIVLFVALAAFQTILSYINTTSTENLLSKTMELYREDSAENLADVTATSLELLLEHEMTISRSEKSRKMTIRELNIILSQQMLQQNVNSISIVISDENNLYTFDDGKEVYAYFFDHQKGPQQENKHRFARRFFRQQKSTIMQDEQIRSYLDEQHAFHVLVPFVPMGELSGALYMKISPDFSDIEYEIASVYDETGAIFSALILISLLAVFYISSYTINERDQAQQNLFDARQSQMRKEIEHQKEALFTRRIYHAHHKAEKVMGFIKEDVRAITSQNIDSIKNKIIKYANFVSRVIYDMKSYDPPMNVIRNPIFQTRINDVVRFIVDNIFNRVYQQDCALKFKLELDADIPALTINEYVVWEILEPLIQNSIDHNPKENIKITIKTVYHPSEKYSVIFIEDDGQGFKSELLEEDKNGVKKLFLEHVSTKKNVEKSGYGCYISYEISKNRCGWKLDAENIVDSGSRFMLTIPHA